MGKTVRKPRLRDELLDGEIFYTLKEAQVVIEEWHRHYNTIRPHSSLGYRPPAPETIIPPSWPSGSAPPDLLPIEDDALDPSLDRQLIADIRGAGENEEAALSENTRRAYATGWKQYEAWCRARYLKPLDANPEQISTFLSSLVPTGAPQRKLSTLADLETLIPVIPDRLLCPSFQGV